MTYDRDVEIERVRFVEGDHYLLTAHVGGWFESLALELRIDGVWVPAQFQVSEALNVTRVFQIIDLVLPGTVLASGIRITGPGSASHGATESFVTCLELDALSPEVVPTGTSFDLNGDGAVDVDDLYRWVEAPVDLNADGAAGVGDAALLRDAVRWGEAGQIGR